MGTGHDYIHVATGEYIAFTCLYHAAALKSMQTTRLDSQLPPDKKLIILFIVFIGSGTNVHS